MSRLSRDELKVAAERGILVRVELPGRYVDPQDPFAELRALVRTAGAEVVGELRQKRDRPSGRTYLGKGKVQELAELAKLTRASLVIFDHDLSPKQIKSVEEETSCKIIDRSELILDIFANRATTHAAKLQVEIAQLQYTYPRLRAMWSHLERIVGGAPVGIGTRGPGEKQLEMDRRLVQRRLAHLKSELAEVLDRKHREVAHRNRGHFTVGLVGYTNAGKSTLFNRLTTGGAFAHEKLFATLSTRVERWDLGGGNDVMLSDTVGFIRDLPHQLVASFRSTLEETIHAQLIVVLLDVTAHDAEMQLRTVEETLDEIGATEQPRILALNKVDCLEDRTAVLLWLNRHPDSLPISARTGEGLEEIVERVRRSLLGAEREVELVIPLREEGTIAFLEDRARVLERAYGDGTAILRVCLGRRHVEQLLARGSSLLIDGHPAAKALAALWPSMDQESYPQRTPPHEAAPAP